MNPVLESMGDVISVDSDGYLQKTVSRQTIQPELMPLIEQITTTAKQVFGNNLHSLYIRGSVAKGTFIPNISDLDTLTVTHEDCGDDTEREFISKVKMLEEEYPNVQGIERSIKTVSEFMESGNPIFKYQTVCVHGEDLSERMRPLKPGKDTTVHLPKIIERLEAAQESIASMNQDRLKVYSVWICKQAIRSCHELLAEQLQQFTRDIYPCYKAASDTYPDQEPLLRKTAEIAVFGTVNKDELLDVVSGMYTLLKPKVDAFYSR